MTEQQISSVGMLNEYFIDENNDRVKGFFSEPILSKEILEDKLKDFDSKFSHNVSRVTARFLINKDLLETSRINMNNHIEAIIPLEGKFDNLSLVYIGRNNPDRYEDKETILEESIMAREISSKHKPMNYHSAIDRVKKQGYNVSIENSLSIADEERLVLVYNAAFDNKYLFDMNLENVQKLTRNKNNIKAIARNPNNVIVSIGIAEYTETNVNDISFRFAELSDAATHPDYGSKGIYTGTCAMLMLELARKNIDLVYGEARACHNWVNIACKTSGRNHYGMLHKHCKIGGVQTIHEKGPYENLNVWAIGSVSLNNLINGEKNGI